MKRHPRIRASHPARAPRMGRTERTQRGNRLRILRRADSRLRNRPARKRVAGNSLRILRRVGSHPRNRPVRKRVAGNSLRILRKAESRAASPQAKQVKAARDQARIPVSPTAAACRIVAAGAAPAAQVRPKNRQKTSLNRRRRRRNRTIRVTVWCRLTAQAQTELALRRAHELLNDPEEAKDLEQRDRLLPIRDRTIREEI